MRVHSNRDLEPRDDRLDPPGDVVDDLMTGRVGQVDHVGAVGLKQRSALSHLLGRCHMGHHQEAN